MDLYGRGWGLLQSLWQARTCGRRPNIGQVGHTEYLDDMLVSLEITSLTSIFEKNLKILAKLQLKVEKDRETFVVL